MMFKENEAIVLRFSTYEALSEFKDRLYKLVSDCETIRLIDAFDLANVPCGSFDLKIAMDYGWEKMDILFSAVSYHTIQPEGYVMIMPKVTLLSDNVDRKGKIV